MEHPPAQVPGRAGEAEPHKRNDTPRGPLRGAQKRPARPRAVHTQGGREGFCGTEGSPLRPGSAPVSEELKAPGACVRVSTAFLCILQRHSAQAGHQGLPGAGCPRTQPSDRSPDPPSGLCLGTSKYLANTFLLNVPLTESLGTPCSCAPRDAGRDGGRFSSLPGSGLDEPSPGERPQQALPSACMPLPPPVASLGTAAHLCLSERDSSGGHGWRPHDPASLEL